MTRGFPSGRFRRWPTALLVTLVVAAASLVGVDPTNSGRTVPVAAAEDMSTETGAVSPETLAREHVTTNHRSLGLAIDDVADLEVTDVTTSAAMGTRTVYLRQRFKGVAVHGAVMGVTIDADGEVLHVASSFVPGLAKLMPATKPKTSVLDATVAVASALGVAPSEPIAPLTGAWGAERATRLSDGGISKTSIPARLVLQPLDDGSVALAWELTIDELEGQNWWQVRVDAATGIELDRNNLVALDSYRVYDAPTEAPTFGPRTVVVDPADSAASPFGWHDTDGVPGAESTLTEGNNVIAYTDTAGNDDIDPGSQPDGGPGLVFDNPVDLAMDPSTYSDAVVTNLFYWNNLLHDTFYAYGFDEAAGNFQQNNYGKGGAGLDPVLAEALDGSGINNANFATPPDGTSPRMQMFVFNPADPDRSASFDNSVVAHEYAHGVTNRITGGPSNVFCLNEPETAGEGWSDFFALMMTMRPGDSGSDARGFGTYILGEPTTGPGLRSHPYSTNMGIDPRTYDEIKTATVPHGVGSTFAAMLWEMAWALIDRDGFDSNLISGTGGNITAMQLVINALSLQPCNPGFVDSRDAILLADQLGFGGANECLIWTAFAKRGLGLSAVQGSPLSRADGTEAFDVPPQCRDLQLTKSADAYAIPSAIMKYSIDATNNSATSLTGVTIVDTIPADTEYVPGSGTCGATLLLDELTMTVGDLGSGTTTTCEFDVRVTGSATTQIALADDIESGTANWLISHGAGVADWATDITNPRSVLTSFFAADVGVVSDQYLQTAASVTATATTTLRFWHDYDTEHRWDGGVVEISVDAGPWTDAGPLIVQNGYDEVLLASSNPISGRLAFTGVSNGYIETVVDLGSHAGSQIDIRFRSGSDSSIGIDGWHIDDVRIADEQRITNTATATSIEGPTDTTFTTSELFEHGMLRVTTDPPLPSQILLDGRSLDRWGIDWMKIAPGDYEVCFTDINGWETPNCEAVVITPGVTSVVEGSFSQNGYVRIVTDPPMEGTITVDGVPGDDWEVWVDMTPGLHDICFGEVEDHLAPECVQVTVVAGAPLQTITGVYVPSMGEPGPSPHGLLRVTTSPGVPSTISLNGVERDTWALNWVKLDPGAYEICYSDVIDFDTPGCETVDVVAGQITATSGVFAPRGFLRVMTDLPHPSTIYVDGSPRDDWGIWNDISPGQYQVCFGEDAGFTPPCESVAVTAGNTSTVTGTWP